MANINIRIDDSLKKEAETIFANIGLNSTTAINLFFRQVVRTNSIPFDLIADIPNQKTIDAIEEGRRIAKNHKKSFNDLEALKGALDL
ncbi:MAG: type II toxin-antitoxin system RelB/DinJ family antitoxin [Bacilli bacterium]|nr:type II toxin-antitoxin system RelB/DinJ family antitoxin [Bacilli bacterium]